MHKHHEMSVSSIDRTEIWCWDCGKSVPNNMDLERHEEINLEEEENQNRLNLEEAVLDEDDEEKVKEIAFSQGAFPDENI